MNIWDLIYGFTTIRANKTPSLRFGINLEDIPDVKQDPEPHNHTTIYTCCRILADNLSRMPIEVKRDGKPDPKHKLYSKLRYKPNNYQNTQMFWSTVEYNRDTFGNAFVDIRREDWEIIPPQTITDYELKNGQLTYIIDWSLDPYQEKGKQRATKIERIPAQKLLHFRGISGDGIIGLSPIAAALQNMKIRDKATGTIVSFYNNRAVSPLAIESRLDSPSAARAFSEGMDKFEKTYVGVQNAGKPIQLPPNTKLTPLSIQFADAQLIETLKFTRDEITAMYGIPSFMINDKEIQQMDIEQQSLEFRSFTLAPITRIYQEELEFKLLSDKDRRNGITIEFDTDVLVEVDIETKAMAYNKMVTTGLMSPNEAAAKLGTQPIQGPFGDMKFLQAQYVPIEMFDKYNPLMKEDPTVKTKATDNTEGKVTEKPDKPENKNNIEEK